MVVDALLTLINFITFLSAIAATTSQLFSQLFFNASPQESLTRLDVEQSKHLLDADIAVIDGHSPGL